MEVVCPLCQKTMKSQALHFHIRNNHPKEYKETGYRKLKAQSKKVPKKEPTETALKEASSQQDATSEKKDTDMDGWKEETSQRVYFSPTPITYAIMNQFSKSTDHSDIINKAVHEFASARGIQPAIVKTEGGQSMEMLGGNSEDHEFNKVMKLIAANNQVQSSYNQYSPMFQMIQAMKDKVNNGMSMGSFGKELMQMVFMMKMMGDEE